MSPESLVEVADRKSRLRAVLFAVATIVFLFVQVITRPAFSTGSYAHGWRMYAWAVNAAVLLLLLGGGGGFMNRAPLRALLNDEVAQSHYRTACKAGFWIAMLCGLVLYVVPAFASFTGHQVSYVVVSLGTVTALLTFAWLEYRSHGDA
jgi:hypothetical protein